MKNNKIARAMKKKILLIMLIAIAAAIMPAFCTALEQVNHVIISEVLYDPITTETGGEAVEIYNPTAGPIDISGYVIKTESSAADATIPAGTILEPHTFYLIADIGWSTLKDNAAWQDADHEEAITLTNTDAGVAIVHPNGTTLDAIGWGNTAGISPGLYEENPATPTSAGESLARADLTQDTDNNSQDFTASVPDPNNSSTTIQQDGDSATTIPVSVTIMNSPPSIISSSIQDEDNLTAGAQIIPVPESQKEIRIRAQVSEPDGTSTIESVTAMLNTIPARTVELSKTQDINTTEAIYEGAILMEFYDAAGTYNITMIAADATANSTATIGFQYLSMTAISIDAASLQFTNAALGSTTEVRGDFALSTQGAPTIRNIGNTIIDIGVYGTDMTGAAGSIAIGNMKYSLDNDFGSGLSGTISTTLQIMSIGLENGADSLTGMGFQIYIPPTTNNGNYTGSVTIVAVSS